MNIKKMIAICSLMLILPRTLVTPLDPGYSRGMITSEDRTIPLTHCTVMIYGNEEGILERQELRVLLSDRDVSESILSGPFLRTLERMVKEGGLRGVLLRMDPKKPTRSVVQGTILIPAEDPGAPLPSFTIHSRGGGFEHFEMGNNRIWGETRWNFTHGLLSPLEYHAKFSAPLFQDVVTERHLGKGSHRTPQVLAMLAFERGLRAGNLEAIQQYASKARFEELKAYVNQVGADAFLEEMSQSIPPEEARRKEILGVYVRGKNACITYQRGQEKHAMWMVDENGTWKVD